MTENMWSDELYECVVTPDGIAKLKEDIDKKNRMGSPSRGKNNRFGEERITVLTVGQGTGKAYADGQRKVKEGFGMKNRIYYYVTNNEGCSYRDIREWISNRGYLYEGKCIENAIHFAVGSLVEEKLLCKVVSKFNLDGGKSEEIYRYYTKTGKSKDVASDDKDADCCGCQTFSNDVRPMGKTARKGKKNADDEFIGAMQGVFDVLLK